MKKLDNSVETVLIEEKKLEKFDRDEIEEVLDDGVYIIALKSDNSEINNFFDEDVCEDDDTKGVIGYKIEKNGEDVISEPISIKAIDIDGEEVENGKEYEELINNATLNAQDCNALYENSDDEEYIEQLSADDVAVLQASNSIGSSYAEKSRTTYFYGKSGLSCSTKALEKGKSPGSGWNKMGFSTITLAVFNVGGKSKKRYDLFLGTMQVGALKGYKLTDFTGQMRLYNQNKCSIIDCTTLKGDSDETVSTSIGAGLGASESGLSASLSAGYSYTYNPNGMKIKNLSGDSELQPNWKCSKKLEDCDSNERYVIKPSILVKSPNGKTKETKVSMRVKNLQFHGKYKYYDVANSSGSEYVYLVVRNHKKV